MTPASTVLQNLHRRPIMSEFDHIPREQIIERVTHYDHPQFSWDENRLFWGGFYPYIAQRPVWCSRWDWHPEEGVSRLHCIQRIIRPHYPLKNDRAREDDEFCLRLCLGAEMVLVRREILDTRESQYDMRERYSPPIRDHQRDSSWGSSFYSTD